MLTLNIHGRQLAAPTPKLTGQTGTPKARSSKARTVNLLTQPFKVAHQRINLDLDLARKRIVGFTELTIVPTLGTLRAVKLDARGMAIKNIYINGSVCNNYIHQDMLYINDLKIFEDCVARKAVNLYDLYSSAFSIHQHHLIRQKLNYIFGEVIADQYTPDKLENTNTEELGIILPKNLKLELTDGNAFATPSSQAAGLTPLQLRAKNTHSESYTPITVGIEYEIINPKNGVNFICDLAQNKKNWHVYTVNSEYNVSTSSWVPCIDNMWERNTWSVELTIPRSTKNIADLLPTTKIESASDVDGMDVDQPENIETVPKDEDDESEEDEDDSENFDLTVCTGDFNNTKESPHPIDLSKKIVSWSIFNPICAHHIGWAVGAFQSVELSSFEDHTSATRTQEEGFEEIEEIEKDETSSSVMLYFLPGQQELAQNTCIFAHQAVDFFLKEFGSYPFATYAITFVVGPTYPYNNFAGLTFLSDSLLYPADVIEPMFETTDEILACIAGQWSGINIVPQVFNDIWCTVGIARFMSFQFLRVLMGQNQLRYQIKLKMDQIILKDVGRCPLGLHALNFPVSESDFDFVRLKAPIILYILDHRMTKTDKSFGLSRVLPKIFLQAMSGDLQNGTLSTQHFQYVCERVYRNRLESFFKQWVHGVGTPSFVITQRFNKKRSLIEVVIRQTQAQQAKVKHPTPETFVDESLTYLNDRPIYPVQPTFLGPMTIRVHEADGTPYEHIVDIKDSVVKFDVQYNTKFKRLKKTKEESSESNPVFAKLGNILGSQSEVKQWNFEEWPKRDEEFLDPFEWIRVDTDFEWIARFNVKQPDYMFASQLQQDRDIEAQIAAIEYFGNQDKPTTIYCTSLTRTLMDSRYFYGVRIAAAKALARFSHKGSGFAGLDYLMMAYKHLFCFDDSFIPKSNSFEDFGRFFLQKSMPRFLSEIRDDDGKVPLNIKGLLFNLWKYNDNSNNDFQDCFYVCDIVEALTDALIPSFSDLKSFDYHLQRENRDAIISDDQTFIDKVVQEINRIERLDGWIPSYQSKISYTCIKQKIKLASFGLIDFSFEKLLLLTTKKYPNNIRVLAFKGLLSMGGMKNSNILKYFLETCLLDESTPQFKTTLIGALLEAVSEAAIYGTPSMYDDPEFRSLEKIFENGSSGQSQTNLIVIDDVQGSELSARRDHLARATIKGAIDILRRDLSVGLGLQQTMWELVHTSLIGLIDRRTVFILCGLLYQERNMFPVTIPVPCVPFEELRKKIIAKDLGEGKIVIKREGRFRISLSTKLSQSLSKLKLNIKKAPEKHVVTHNRNTRARTSTNPEEESVSEPSLKLKLSTSSNTDVVPVYRAPIVSLDSTQGFKVKFLFKKHTLAPLPALVGSAPVTVNATNVTFKFTSARILRRLKSFSAPPRFVKISTRRGRVSLSATPFEDVTVKKEPEAAGIAEPETAETAKPETPKTAETEIAETEDSATERAQESKKAAETSPKVSEPVSATAEPSKGATPATSPVKTEKPSRQPSQEPETTSRSKSPFSAEPSPGLTKRKKTKIYIHGQDSQALSPKSTPGEVEVKKERSREEVNDDGSEEKSENGDNREKSQTVEKEKSKPESEEKPRPKLKLKLTLK